MMRGKIQILGWMAGATLALSLGAAQAGPLPAGWSSTGNAGTNTTDDGVVTLIPGLNSYQWISTYLGEADAGKLPTGATGQETNGSRMRTLDFTVSAGDKLDFSFNYITSDGAGYTEYAWAGLFNGPASFDSYLFTARTTTSGDTVPGFELPVLGTGVTLSPASSAIIAGAPEFSPLGISSNFCYDDGCGYTGWIEVEYTFTAGGTYHLEFGVTNAIDDEFNTALAVGGVAINDKYIDNNNVPEPATLAP